MTFLLVIFLLAFLYVMIWVQNCPGSSGEVHILALLLAPSSLLDVCRRFPVKAERHEERESEDEGRTAIRRRFMLAPLRSVDGHSGSVGWSRRYKTRRMAA